MPAEESGRVHQNWNVVPGDNSCLCNGAEQTEERNHDACEQGRREMARIGGEVICRQVLGRTFKIVPEAVFEPNSEANGMSGMAVSAETDNSGSDDDNGEENIGSDNVWVEVLCEQFLYVEKVLDTTLQLVAFCLVEPIGLGFFQFQT